MKCKWEPCDNEARGKSPFCGGTCKKRHQRASGTDVPVEVGQELSGTQVGQTLGSASSTQNTDEQEVAQSTKSDAPDTEQQENITRQQLADAGANPHTIDTLAAYPSAFDDLPGGKDYAGCVTPDRIAASKCSSKPTTAQPVDESKVEVEC